jgi:hypothetical protein
MFLGIGLLRTLQTETGSTFTKNWSWAPYAIVVVTMLAAAGITWLARGKRRASAPNRSMDR